MMYRASATCMVRFVVLILFSDDGTGPGGNYHIFAGREIARALAMGKLHEDYLNNDLQGLNTTQITALQEWQKFYTDRYKKVGRIV